MLLRWISIPRHVLLPVVFLSLFALPALLASLQAGEPGTGSIAFRLSYYNNNDDDDAGNPYLDETLEVAEPVMVFDYNVTDKDTVWAKASYDWVSSASIARLSAYTNHSGASGDYYISLGGGWSRQVNEDNKWAVSGHASVEHDYQSYGLSGDWTRELPDKGASVKLGIGGFIDEVDIIRFNGSDADGNDHRTSLTTSLGWYQTHSPVLHGEYGAVLTVQDGFLETAYNAVVIEDTDVPNPNLVNNAPGREVTEELENQRVRAAVYNRTRYSLTQTDAIELGTRLYADSWGITSLSLEPRLYFSVHENLLIRLRYRYYTQTPADHYARRFNEETEFRTQDADLGDYHANTLGVKFTWKTNTDSEYDLGADYTRRSDDLNYYLISSGYRYSF